MKTPPEPGEVKTTMRSETENQNRSYNCSPQSDLYDTEPADPSRPDHNARRQLPLVPDSVKLDRYPDELQEDGQSLPVKEAGETHRKIELSWLKGDPKKSKHRRHKKHYWGIHEADRRFIEEYDGLTTVLLTRRLSPLDGNDNWLTPWECDQMLHGGRIHRSVREALDYHLDGFEYGWVAVTAPTKSAGTPHEHIYIWIEDPDNQISTDHIAPALEKHLRHCVNAYERHHQYRVDGSDGAIMVQHSPERTADGNTKGATYVASQLAHLPIGDFVAPSKNDPPVALIEGAVLAWASPFNWFRSNGEAKKRMKAK